MKDAAKNWCEEFFDDLFAEHHLVRSEDKEMRDTLAFLKDKLHLRSGGKILDQCCGVGSLSIAMAKMGYDVAGFDLIPSYIDRAKRDAAAAGVSCDFETGDAHAYIYRDPRDAVVNWWTSFGYAKDDAQNIKMLRCAAASLKSGGYFVLDYMNAPQRLRDFAKGDVAYSETKKADCTIVWESRLDRASEMIVKKWICQGADGRKVEKQGGGAKLYSSAQLERMLAECGFVDITFYGSIGGEALTGSSPRCIAVARKE